MKDYKAIVREHMVTEQAKLIRCLSDPEYAGTEPYARGAVGALERLWEDIRDVEDAIEEGFQ